MLLAIALTSIIALALSPALAFGQQSDGGREGERKDPRDTSGPLDISSASFAQDQRQLVFTIKTRAGWTVDELTERAGRRLCLRLMQPPGKSSRGLFCVGRSQGSADLDLIRTGDPGPGPTVDFEAPLPIHATVTQGKLLLTARFLPSAVGLKPGRFRWSVLSSWVDDVECAITAERPAGCTDQLPDSGSVLSRLHRVREVGCRARGSSFVTAGHRGRAVALTFDDGPWTLTAKFLDLLKRKRVHATFFVVGSVARGKGAILKRMLAEGHSIGNHSLSHASLAGGGAFAAHELDATQRIVRAAANFTPCVFRAPGGAVSGGLISQARARGMITVQWDVDPLDWRTPGAGAIYSRIVGSAGPGSIILMHDGGGPRGQTLSALPRVIDTLRARHYRLMTVPDLLRLKPVYGFV